MKNLVIFTIQYYVLQVFIILDLIIITISFSKKAYFLCFFILLSVIYMIHRLDKFYAPIHLLCKRFKALENKVNKIIEQDLAISIEEKNNFLKEVALLREEFYKILKYKNFF